MSRVITFSRVYPAYHPKAGQQTFFIEKIYAKLADTDSSFKIPNYANEYWDWHEYYNCSLPKGHTIRAGHRWKSGDWFSPRVWSGKPYNSKQIIIAPDIQVKRVWNFELHGGKPFFKIIDCPWTSHLEEITDETLELIAKNDGLLLDDFMSWFHDFSKEQECQIICWDEKINY